MDDNNFLNNKLDKLYNYLNNLNYLDNDYNYNLSRYFLNFVEKSLMRSDENISINEYNITKNIVYNLYTELLVLNQHDNYIKLLNDNYNYIKYVVNNISKYLLIFKTFLDSYDNIDNNMKIYFIKEFLIASSTTICIIPFGKIKNFDLWFYITSIWIIFDNIMDIPDLKNKYELIKESCIFFKNKIYKKSYNDIVNFISNSNEPCLKFLNKIFLLDNIDNNTKIKICKKFAKLYKYSYEVKKFKQEKETSNLNKIIKISILKCKKSLDIFKYSLELNNMNKVKEYNICLIIQLMDDFVDLIDDYKTNNNTIFINKKQDNIDRLITLIILLEKINKYMPELKIFFLLLVIVISDYNSEFLDLEYVNKLKNKVNIDFKNFNVNKVLKLMEDNNFIEKCFKIYLNNNLLSKDYYKLNKEEIINEISQY